MPRLICSWCKKIMCENYKTAGDYDSHGCCESCYNKISRGKEVCTEMQMFINRIENTYSKAFIKSVLDELKFENLDDVFKKGKKNVIESILRDRTLFQSGHSMIGDMQYDRIHI